MPSLVFITASLTTATIIKATKVVTSDDWMHDWMNKTHISAHKMEHFCLIKESWGVVTAQINTADIMLSEISQAWKEILYNPIHVWNLKKVIGIEIIVMAIRGWGMEGWWDGRCRHVGQRAQGCS